MRKCLWDISAVVFIFFLVGTFFFPFFFPEPKLLVTPDFGRSDSWHFSIPTKFLLWKNLQANELPLWEPTLGGGFPLFAEGQVGALYPINLLFFKFFDFVTAYNLALSATVFIFALGTYVFLSVITKSRLGALLGATSIALSGIVIPQLPHIALLQGISLMPWILLTTHYLIERSTLARVASVAILLALQIFAGFPQATFVTLLFAAAFVLWKRNSIVVFACSVLLGLALAGVQLVPSLEFLQQSSVSGGFAPDEASYFSYPWKHLKTLLDPFALGNPKEGTYPHFGAFDGSIFWENSAFVGLVPLALALIAIVRRSSSFFLLTCLLSLLLATGKHSPLYLIYSFWPFNLFRVPSRFVWVFVFSLVTLASYGVASMRLRKLFLVVLVLLNSFHLWNTWKNYHALVPAVEWLDPPPHHAAVSGGHLYTLGAEKTHNQVFAKSGWVDIAPYEGLRASFAADSNVFWNVSSAQVYAGRALRRYALAEGLLLAEINLSDETASVSAFGDKLLSLSGVDRIITQTLAPSKRPGALPRWYLARDGREATTLSQAARTIASNAFILGESVLVAQPVATGGKRGGKVALIRQSDAELVLRVTQNAAPSLLVLRDAFYPGWLASVDGHKEPVIPVNIKQRGILIAPGEHTVRLWFQPTSIVVGSFISLASALLILVLLAGYRGRAGFFHKRPKALLPLRGSSRNPLQRKPYKG